MTSVIRRCTAMFCIGLLAIICGAHSASAQTHTWIGTTGDWFEGTNWDAGVPTAGATVVISAGAVALTNTTEALSSFTLNGGTLTFSNWTTCLIATNILINTGTVTHVTNLVSTTNNLGQWIPVARVNLDCGMLFVKTGAAINVNSKGYPGGTNGGISRGQGPGGGYAGGRGGGGGHGGRGGPGIYTSVDVLFAGGDTNGVASAPVNPGSGGAAGGTAGERGGYGGGAIVITASGAVTNNGIISANGGPYLGASTTRSGGGSGGSVYLTCDTVAGLGSFQASGGNGYVSSVDNGGGGGGGGRIAIRYNPAAQSNQPLPQLAFVAGAGAEPASSRNVPMAEVGTLYFPDSQFMDPLAVMGPANFRGQLIPGEALAWSAPNLVVSNTVIRFPGSGFEVSVLTNLTIDGSGRLEIGNTSYRLSDARMVLFNDQPQPTRLTVGGQFHVKKGTLFVYACPTNAGVPDYGALVSVTGDMTVSTGSVVRPVSHPENGGSALFRAGRLIVEEGGTINADYTGYFCDQGPGKGTKNIRAGGGGYGGSGGGGQYVYSWGGKPYGSADEPVQAGSGGGSWGDTQLGGGRGGGSIRLQVSGQVVCNGTVSASGEYGMSASGGGSGGSLLIVCDTFVSTNGMIRANGANAGDANGGGGGGGRIALRYNSASQAAVPRPIVTITASAGTGQNTADIGTIYLPDTRLLTNEIIRFSGQLTGFNSWATDSLLVSNCFIRFPDDGFALTVSNRLTVMGSAARLDIGGNTALQMTSTNIHYHVYNSGNTRPALSVGGDLVLTNKAALYVFSMATNDLLDYGALVTVGGTVDLAPQTWINPVSNPTNGGSPLFRIGSLQVATNAGFRADRTGFFSQRGPGKGAVAGGRGGGAGYGGKGGRGSDAGSLGGQPYGSSNPPVDCGSGGGTVNSGSTTAADYGGRGGGLVRIEAAGQVKLDGTLSSAGETMPTGAQASGAGSGGGVYLQCRRLTGVGSFTANGGAGRPAIGGGGGGGRIAVYATGGGAFTGIFSANGGTGYESGALGSIVYESRSSGTVMLIR